jgi:hypothetical protein
VLAVVDHEEHLAGAQVLDELVQRGTGGPVGDAQRGTDGVRDAVAAGEHRELDEPHAVGEGAPRLLRDVQRETGLADPADPGQRHQPGLLEQPADLPALLTAPHEPGRRGRQHRRCPAEQLVAHRLMVGASTSADEPSFRG